MRILFIDIETTPNIVDTWGLFDQNVGINQIRHPSKVLSVGYKWKDYKPIHFYHSKTDKDYQDMVTEAWEVLHFADVVVHWNGNKFDIPTLNKEFVTNGLKPPSPSKQVDLCLVSRRTFNFPSHKLAYVSQALGLEGKVKHSGHELWQQCMAGDEKAWKEMEKYNKQDVKLLDDIYDIFLPWIPNHPNVNLYSSDILEGCPSCGSSVVNKEGYRYTQVAKFQRYSCKDCGRWFTDGKAIERVELR